ncbi:ribonuclease H-like domain-containing protein [Tanacetum coccineum]
MKILKDPMMKGECLPMMMAQNFINDFYENSEFYSDIEELPVNTLRRSSRQTKLPSSLNDFIVEGKSVESTCYEKAILDRNWIDAMDAEIEALNENHTWVITDLPPNKKAIGNKWIFKIKYKASGDIDRYKARLPGKSYVVIPEDSGLMLPAERFISLMLSGTGVL